jgi:chromosome segregation ATPase
MGDEGVEPLVVEIARELYDRFVMGGWEPQDAYPQIERWLASLRAEVARLQEQMQIIAQNAADASNESCQFALKLSEARGEVARLQEELAAHKGTCGDLWEQVARLEKERDEARKEFTARTTEWRDIADSVTQRAEAAEARIRKLEEK